MTKTASNGTDAPPNETAHVSDIPELSPTTGSWRRFRSWATWSVAPTAPSNGARLLSLPPPLAPVNLELDLAEPPPGAAAWFSEELRPTWRPTGTSAWPERSDTPSDVFPLADVTGCASTPPARTGTGDDGRRR